MDDRSKEVPRVAVGSTGRDPERLKKIPIAKKRAAAKVAISLAQGGAEHASLPDLRSGDRLLVSGELEVTTDCHQPQENCVEDPYTFAPQVEAGLLLASGRNYAEPSAGKAIALGRPQRRSVTHPRHHDVFVFDNVEFKVPEAGLPWKGQSSANLALAAWHPQSDPSRHFLLVGQHEPDGTVAGDMGGISVARLRPADQLTPKPIRTSERKTKSIPVVTGDPQKAVVYSQRLDELRAGEQLRVRAAVKTSSAHLGYPARATVEIVLSIDPVSVDPGGEAKRVCPESPQISRGNGKNCLPSDKPMSSSKTGVLRVARDAKAPLYVNVFVTTGDPLWVAKRGDMLAIIDGGFLTVNRYPSDLLG